MVFMDCLMLYNFRSRFHRGSTVCVANYSWSHREERELTEVHKLCAIWEPQHLEYVVERINFVFSWK